MRVYVCVDDTDDLTKSTSTGKIADLISEAICEKGATMLQGVTRHQLLIHEDIDYTSHNSSMCMILDTDSLTIEDMEPVAVKVLKENMAASSDPGLCFCEIGSLAEPQRLIAYGKRAQNEVITKDEAYALAGELGITLKEYGGTGIGIIGALAGVGLRLSGNDGVFRGGKDGKFSNQIRTAGEWKEATNVEQVVDFREGIEIDDDAPVQVGDKFKVCLVNHKITLVVKEGRDGYKSCNKKELYEGDRRITEWTGACERFTIDNDIEECYDENEEACYNCLYRRWTATGFECVAPE